MTIKDYIDNIKITIPQLAEMSDIPDSTLRDIMDGTSDLRRCTADTVCKLATALEIPVGGMMHLEPIVRDMPLPSLVRLHEYKDPELFRAYRQDAIEHLDRLGRLRFIEMVLDDRVIEEEYADGDYASALFLIGFTDYLADKDPILPRITRYDRYRGDMMAKPVFPFGRSGSSIDGKTILNNAVPQLLKFNFIETPDTLKIPALV